MDKVTIRSFVENNPNLVTMKQRKFQWIDDGIHGEAAATSCNITGIELPDGDNMVIQISSVQDEDS